MPFRKKIQTSQLPDLNAPKKAVNNTASSAKPAASVPQSSPQNKRKSAWLDAPLPQFYDQELATEMVRLGYYATFEEAYVEVPESRLISIRQQIEDYLLNTQPPKYWRNVPLPSPKK